MVRDGCFKPQSYHVTGTRDATQPGAYVFGNSISALAVASVEPS
jgi:hypothetical protein